MAYFSSSPTLDCIVVHLHNRASVGSVACILGNFITWPRYDWREIWLALMALMFIHSFALLSFVLLSFSGSRQCFSFGIGSFSFTEGTPLFLLLLFFNLSPFFNLVSYLWRTDRRLHAINPDMLFWNVFEPWPYLALLRGFEQRALGSCIVLWEFCVGALVSVEMFWSLFVGFESTLIYFCRVNCRVPFCLLILVLHFFFIRLDPIRSDALPGLFFHSPQFDTLPSPFLILLSILCLVIFHLNSLSRHFLFIFSIRYSV